MNLTKKIKQAKKILIVGHVRPDGDCLGAGLALYRLAQKSGTQAELVYDSDLPFHYSFMQYYDCINKVSLSDYDLLIIVDCGDRFRMGKYAEFLGKVHSIQFDHHISNDGFADENYVYPYRSSTCEILSEILLDEDAVDSEMATLLYVGLSTDTGHFMHNNVTSVVFSLAAKLMEKGADAYNVNCALYRSRTWEKTKLIGKAIQSMKFFGDGSICVISVMQSDLTDCGCSLSDTEGLIDVAMDIGSVKVAVCMTQQPNNKYKVSMRSKGFDVARAAAVFGGGGHVQAAGCVVCGYYEDVLRKVVKSITDGM